MEKSSNPVLEVYRGKPIRKYNLVLLRVSMDEMKMFIDAKLDEDLSARKAIQRKKLLCDCSQPTLIVKSEYAKGH